MLWWVWYGWAGSHGVVGDLASLVLRDFSPKPGLNKACKVRVSSFLSPEGMHTLSVVCLKASQVALCPYGKVGHEGRQLSMAVCSDLIPTESLVMYLSFFLVSSPSLTYLVFAERHNFAWRSLLGLEGGLSSLNRLVLLSPGLFLQWPLCTQTSAGASCCCSSWCKQRSEWRHQTLCFLLFSLLHSCILWELLPSSLTLLTLSTGCSLPVCLPDLIFCIIASCCPSPPHSSPCVQIPHQHRVQLPAVCWAGLLRQLGNVWRALSSRVSHMVFEDAQSSSHLLVCLAGKELRQSIQADVP